MTVTKFPQQTEFRPARAGVGFRDFIATLLVAATAAIAYAAWAGWDWPLVGSVRPAVAAIGLIGLGACITGGLVNEVDGKPQMPALGSFLGFAAFVLVVAGLITASETVLIALEATVIVLWLVTTARHAIRT